jgi:hypothetical protein
MDRERESHVSRLFIEVTPRLRHALELLAETSTTLLDEIDAPADAAGNSSAIITPRARR